MIPNIIYSETKSNITTITIANTRTRNAFDLVAVQQLEAALKQAMNDDFCRVIVLQAEGEDFIRGLDLEWAFAEGRTPNTTQFNLFSTCLHLIYTGRLPVIACVEGQVTGGGVELVSACDLVLATPETKFMISELIVGMIPPMGMPYLMRRVGVSRAKYLTLSSRSVSAEEAHKIGLVDEVAQGEMSQVLKTQLQRLLRSSPQAIAEMKRYITVLDEGVLKRQNDLALDLACSWVVQPEVAAGVRAFAEGFAPPWFQKYKG